MNPTRRRLIVVLLGILLLLLPMVIRNTLDRYRPYSYQPPNHPQVDLAFTPQPTPTAHPAPQEPAAPDEDLTRGVVVVDLAHYNELSPLQFQALAAQLAADGVGVRYWINTVDIWELGISTYADLPDQSETLSALLEDATGLVVVSPVFLWTREEVDVAEKFVADGGRLLLISDPDIPEVPDYYVHDINNLAEPFGVVFNDDYLYDVENNDKNYTHFKLEEFFDRAATWLEGKTVVFYGARSIGGPVVSQARTSDTTRSSLRAGLSRFTPLAIGGQVSNNTAGNVLAMSDFDVLTEPYVSRFDNRAMLEFVADFLAGGARIQTLADFPAYLGKHVDLVLGDDVPVGVDVLKQSSALQKVLEANGRTMTLTTTTMAVLTDTLDLSGDTTARATPSAQPTKATASGDVIYLGSFETAHQTTTLLQEAGIRLKQEQIEEDAEKQAQEQPVDTSDTTDEAEDESSLEGEDVTPTPSPEGEDETEGEEPQATLTPAPEPTQEVTTTLVLETDFGPRLLASETILILRQQTTDGRQVTAVLGSEPEVVIQDGLNRLIELNFADCVVYPDKAICPYAGEGAPDELETPAGEDLSESSILLLDDDALATLDETSEADLYLEVLMNQGYWPDMWYTFDQGSPQESDLIGYNWVIWSAGEYEETSLDLGTLDVLLAYVEGGGRLTLSGRNLPFGLDGEQATVIVDVVSTGEIPDLSEGFPDEPIQLATDLPPVLPLDEQMAEDGSVVLRRGPDSGDADAPLMLAVSGSEELVEGAKLVLIGMPVTWLPEDYAWQLIQNMSQWMLAE